MRGCGLASTVRSETRCAPWRCDTPSSRYWCCSDRARGDDAAGSDWDLGYLAGPDLDPLALAAALAEAVGSERIDLVDLARASGLLRFRAARDGVLIHEATAGSFDRFRFDAARFWFDAEPVLRAGYDAVLDRLG